MKEYEFTPAGGVPTTVQLSDEEADRLGLKPKAAAKSKTPANKAAKPENKSSAADKRAEAVAKSMNARPKGDA